MKGKKDIPYIFYIYLHSKIVEYTNSNVVSVKSLKKYLSNWHIPVKIRPLLLKEMEIMGLVEKHGKHELKLNKPVFDIENCNKYYRRLKVW